ncbi:hypothetical protein N7447_003068 [Penicillium robsamsonii]|uniref:uncharacterized protein n=1 Tax=Penicillium robsamsonii TaxID=1792511 RepID=UPI002549B32C|nr:uncharacterized protein N7447_003068 [Penicillium robsamsonii]KAJ5837042.1 hypothetical protein N7447_003068 [Penicillium robsamsonii]
MLYLPQSSRRDRSFTQRPVARPTIEVPPAPILDPLLMPVLKPLGEPVGAREFKSLPGALIELGPHFLAKRRHTKRKLGWRPVVRSSNPSPEPGLGEAPSNNTQLQQLETGIGEAMPINAQSKLQSPESPRGEAPPSNTQSQSAAQSSNPPATIQSNDALKRKRNAPWSSRVIVPDDGSPPSKKIHTNNAYYKFTWELGHNFLGFVSLTTRDEALEFSNNILQLPVPKTVRKRLIYFCDGSIRLLCGAAGIVWPQAFNSPEWEGTGVYYPFSIDSTATLELFAIASTLEAAIKDMEKTRGDVAPRTDKMPFRGNLGQTRSHQHHMTKEVFVFTDDEFALRRISGKMGYFPQGDIAHQLKSISEHSRILHGLGVHVELHLSPGHSGVPGNEAADQMARRTQQELMHQTATSWPTAQSVEREATTATLVPPSLTS